MKTLFLDIETKPNDKLINLFTSKIKAPKTYKDPEKITAYIEEKKQELVKNMSVDVDFCEIKCICIKVDDNQAREISLVDLIDLLNEHMTIKSELASDYEKRVLDFRLVTFNGKKFDLPVIIREALRNNLIAPYKELKTWTKRFQVSNHIDLMELINDNDFKSLDLYSQIYLGDLPPKIRT